MIESNTRLSLSIAGAVSVLGYIMAMWLGLQGNQGLALIFLILSLVVTLLAFFIYRRYTALRNTRWQDEIKAGEDKMQQMLAEESKKQRSPDSN
ncbi:MAG: hypothetical protein ABI670_10560 [Chloroflexota bacterium]